MVDTKLKRLEKLFGPEFVKLYLQAKQKANELPEQRLQEIKDYAIQHIKESPDFHIKYGNLDIILVSTPESENLRQIKTTSAGNYKVTVYWYGAVDKSLRGPFISVFIPENKREWAEELTREGDKMFFLVGKLREQDYMGDKTFSFRVAGIIPIEFDEEEEEGEEDEGVTVHTYKDLEGGEEGGLWQNV